jgi:hypothetical protein
MIKITFTLLLLLLNSCFTFCSSPGLNNPPHPPETYAQLVSRIAEKKAGLRQAYQDASAEKKDSVIKLARHFLFTTITTDLFSKWYNTPWTFYGHTRTPGEGSIACGYFVTTVLLDAGFNIPSVEWAQLASETFIKKMTADLKRFHSRPMSEVISYVSKREDGLYVTGLDNHVGFVYKNGKSMKFVHSNYYQPDIGVMEQEIDEYHPLSKSNYRVLGRILGDEMVKKWLLDGEFE